MAQLVERSTLNLPVVRDYLFKKVSLRGLRDGEGVAGKWLYVSG